MEAWIIAGVVGVVGTTLVSLAYYFIVRPAAEAEGAQTELERQKAVADALGIGTATTEKVVAEQSKVIDERAAVQKARRPVDVANEEIARRLATLGKKP